MKRVDHLQPGNQVLKNGRREKKGGEGGEGEEWEGQGRRGREVEWREEGDNSSSYSSKDVVTTLTAML